MNTKPFYGKVESQLLSGIALISIFASHLYATTWILPENNFSSIINILWGGDSTYYLSWFGAQFCVSIFAFNTGYSLYVNRETFVLSNYKSILSRIFKFLLSFWVVYLFIVLYALLFKEPFPPTKIILQNLFGLANDHTYVCSLFSWYVYFYISVMLISPMLLWLMKNKNLYLTLVFSLFIALFFLALRILHTDSDILSKIIGSLAKFIRPVLVGVLVAKYDIFNKLNNIIKIKNAVVPLIGAVIVIIIRHLLRSRLGIVEDSILIVVPFIFLTVLFLRNIQSANAEKVLIILAANSMNLWFLHSIFFIGNKPLQWILYMPQDSFLIMVWGIIILLPISMICTYFQKLIITKIFKI